MKMKAVVIYEAGGPEQLKVETREIPKVKEGWTLVKIKGFGINRKVLVSIVQKFLQEKGILHL